MQSVKSTCVEDPIEGLSLGRALHAGKSFESLAFNARQLWMSIVLGCFFRIIPRSIASLFGLHSLWIGDRKWTRRVFRDLWIVVHRVFFEQN